MALGPLCRIWLYSFERLFGSSARSIVGANEKFAQLANNLSLSRMMMQLEAEGKGSITESWRMNCTGPQYTDVATIVMRSEESDLKSFLLEHSCFQPCRVREGRHFRSCIRPATQAEILLINARLGSIVRCHSPTWLPLVEVDGICDEHREWHVTSRSYRNKQRSFACNDGYVAYNDPSHTCGFAIIIRIAYVPVDGNRLQPVMLGLKMKPSQHAHAFRRLTLQHAVKEPRDASTCEADVCLLPEELIGNCVMHPVPEREGVLLACVISSSSAALKCCGLDNDLLAHNWLEVGNLYGQDV
jgi:hypothetical protein